MTTAGAETFDHRGEFFTIDAMPVAPLPTHGRLPLMVGGARPQVLRLAARVADVVNLNTLRDDGPADRVLAEKVGWVREAAADRFADLVLGTSVALVAPGGGSPAAAVEAAVAHDRFARHVTARMSPDDAAAAAFTLAGTADAMTETLLARREAHGVSHVVVPASAADALRPVVARLAGH